MKIQKSKIDIALLFIIFLMMNIGVTIFSEHVKGFFYIKFFIMSSVICYMILYSKKSRILDTTVVFFLCVYICIISISTMTSQYIDITSFCTLCGFILLFLYCILSSYHRSINYAYMLYMAFSLSLLFIFIPSVICIIIPSCYIQGRFNGITTNANTMGWIASILSFIAFYFYRHDNLKKYFLLLVSSILCLLLSQSRTSILALVITLMIYSLIYKDKRICFYIAILVIFAMVIFTVFSNFAPQREWTAETGRMDIIAHFLTSSSSDLSLFGHGLSTEGGRIKSELAYFDIFTTSGILGALSFILCIFFSLKRGIQFLKYNNTYHNINTFIFIMILILSFGDGYISNIGNSLPIFFWFYLGYIIKLNQKTI